MNDARSATNRIPEDFDWKRAAEKLWDILDRIDSVDDAARSDDIAYRRTTRRIAKERLRIFGSDGYHLTLPEASQSGP